MFVGTVNTEMDVWTDFLFIPANIHDFLKYPLIMKACSAGVYVYVYT